MNTPNLKKAIAIMERAKARDSVYMPGYQSKNNDWPVPVPVQTADELHACGNKACFAGHIAISPEFQEDGGSVDDGAPVFKEWTAAQAIANWLEIPEALARDLVYTGLLYNKDWHLVNGDDVLKVLNEILEQGPEAVVERLREIEPNHYNLSSDTEELEESTIMTTNPDPIERMDN